MQDRTSSTRRGRCFRAAQYVRMSTEHQQYSTENQGDKIREYAAGATSNRPHLRRRGQERAAHRRAASTQQLIADAGGQVDFQIILVTT